MIKHNKDNYVTCCNNMIGHKNYLEYHCNQSEFL